MVYDRGTNGGHWVLCLVRKGSVDGLGFREAMHDSDSKSYQYRRVGLEVVQSMARERKAVC